MTWAATKPMEPATRRRNRIALIILIAVVLGSAVTSALYWRHYGFPPEKSESRYH